VQYSAVQYIEVLYSTGLRVQYITAQYSTVQYSAAQFSGVLWHMKNWAVPYAKGPRSVKAYHGYPHDERMGHQGCCPHAEETRNLGKERVGKKKKSKRKKGAQIQG